MTRRRLALVLALVALIAFSWVAQAGLALPRALIDRFFGPRLIRAEVVLQGAGGAVRDFRLDRGRVVAAAPDSLTLRERDGTVVSLQVAPGARVVGLGAPATVAQLRRGWRVLVVRQANQPASAIQVEATR
jgi:hypothetical protein